MSQPLQNRLSNKKEGVYNMFNNIVSCSQMQNSKATKKASDKKVGNTNKEIDSNLTSNI